GRVVNDHRQLIRWNIVAPPDNEVPEIAASHHALPPKMQVRKTNLFSIRHTKPPVHSEGLICGCLDRRLSRRENAKPSGFIDALPGCPTSGRCCQKWGFLPARPRIHRL